LEQNRPSASIVAPHAVQKADPKDRPQEEQNKASGSGRGPQMGQEGGGAVPAL
jgi:hypothetical protein